MVPLKILVIEFEDLVLKSKYLSPAAKISTQETSQLGSQPRYMAKLLSIVRKKVTERTIDVTLKFSLSALWNLTDESPQTCNVFLQEGGMQLFLQVSIWRPLFILLQLYKIFLCKSWSKKPMFGIIFNFLTKLMVRFRHISLKQCGF